jgi:hypothetical protein
MAGRKPGKATVDRFHFAAVSPSAVAELPNLEQPPRDGIEDTAFKITAMPLNESDSTGGRVHD